MEPTFLNILFRIEFLTQKLTLLDEEIEVLVTKPDKKDELINLLKAHRNYCKAIFNYQSIELNERL